MRLRVTRNRYQAGARWHTLTLWLCRDVTWRALLTVPFWRKGG